MSKTFTQLAGRILFSVVSTLVFLAQLNAQSTTITTLPATTFNGSNSLGAPSQVSFVISNTNPYAILLRGVSNWCTTAENNSVWQLYFSATSLTGTSTDVTTTPWTLVATSGLTPVSASGITPLNFPSLSFSIPANTVYRFALRNTGPGNTRYSGSAALSPNSFTAAGVTLGAGDFQIAGAPVGYSGTGTSLTLTPRYFTGAITFEPAAPCTEPPVPGTVTASSNPVCLNTPFTLSLTGATGGTGQTYQWQSSPNNSTWTDVPGATNATLTTTQSVSTYYRVRLTCGSSTVTGSSLLVNTPAAVSGNYTINAIDPPSATNFQSFNAAYNFVRCGIDGPVVFNVAPNSGPYNEQLLMTEIPGASAVNTITFNGNGNTLSFTSTNTSERGVIKLNGADHITFDSLNIVAGGTTTTEYGFGVHLTNNADSNTIRNCTIAINTSSTSTNYAGIAISASATSAIGTGSTLSDGNLISNNTITGGYYGITLVGSNTEANQNNRITGNTIQEWYLYGIYIQGSFNALIEANDIRRPTRATSGTTIYGIYLTGLSTNARISKNRIHSPFDGMTSTANDFYGIFLTGVDALAGLDNIVSNNLIYDIVSNGTVYGLANTGSDNVSFYHNTVSLDDVASTSTEPTRGFFQTTLAAGIDFRNNLITINRGGTGAKHAIYMATATTTYTANNNNYVVAPGATNFIGFNGINQATLAAWQAASTQDAASISVPPLYASAATGNLMPTNASMDNRGVPVGITTDVLGLSRSSTTPDIGAYEFTPGGCTTPPTPGAAAVSESPVCFNAPVTLSVTGNSIGLGQTYRWQTGSSAAGPFTSIGNILTNPDTTILASVTQFYRLAVTCNGVTTFSTPVQLLVNPALPAGTYTINAIDPPSATNFQSFNAAKQAMNCGIAGPVVFNVVANSGPYNEQLILDPIRGASALNTVTFNGNGNTITFLSTNTNERGVIKFNGADHVTFNNLVINATGTTTTEYGFGIHFMNNSDSNTISNCTININTTSTSTNYAGIAMSASATSATTTGTTGCDGNMLFNNTINGGYYGITLVGSSAALINSNAVLSNTISNFYFYGIYVSGTDNSQIEANTISRPTRATVTTFNGVYFTGLSTNARISRNRIFNPFGGIPSSTSSFFGINLTGVDAVAGQENVVSNNVVYQVVSEGLAYGLYNSSSDNVRYFHNTISLDDLGSSSGSSAYGFYQITSAQGIELRNNLISIRRGGGATKFGLYFSTAATTYVSNHNNVYLSTANGFFGFNGTNQATLAAWQAATSQDAASLAVNPIFVAAATGNLMPQSASLDNRGTPVGITADIQGTTRSLTTPDIGAWEFAIPPCTNPPTPGVAFASPNSGICMGAAIQLSLNGNSAGSGQTYQWQTAPSASGPFTNLGTVMEVADTMVFASMSQYYRVAVTCGGNTQFSAPVQVTLNPAFPAGTYTIDPGNPVVYPSNSNFASFTTAVAALECGITGPVVFNVAAGTYTEQIRLRDIFGTGAASRITFQSANGNASSVVLTYDAVDATANYTLELDSAKYITFRNLTINAVNTTNGRAVELAGTASYDSIVNCRINVPVVASTANTVAGIYATTLRGGFNVIKGNTIANGTSGIYISGFSTTGLTRSNVIDSNTVTGTYFYGIYTGNSQDVEVTRNKITVSSPANTIVYGIYSINMDSAYRMNSNEILVNNVTAGTAYGLYMTGAGSTPLRRGQVMRNTITASGNAATLYGMYQTTSIANTTANNVISIQTSGVNSYALYSTGGGGNNYHNNSVNSTASSATNNVAAYFAHTTLANGIVDIRNNVFAHNGGGRALYVTNLSNIYSDYNFLYTTGATLVQLNSANLATLQRWRDTANWDINSISHVPAFISNTNLRPDLTNPGVWAMHGRGVQIEGNDRDFDNNTRPTSFTAGVPDLGAFEFLPTVAPPALTATPANPASGSTQFFMFGTDTVQKITWGPGAVPGSVSVRRYSGVLPPGLASGSASMYFYTEVQTTGAAPGSFTLQQYFIDPWLGFIPSEGYIKMGRTNATGNWLISNSSVTDSMLNVINEGGLSFLGRFTGLSDGTLPPAANPVYVQQIDSSNRGKRFWVGYGHHQNFTANSQDMVLYLSAEQAANVTVRINGTPWVKQYSVPANTVIVSDIIPKSGLYDARLLIDGKSSRGISIESDVPIVAYAHIYANTTSEAAMLLPVGTWGYEYTALTTVQNYADDTYSWVMVIAERDNTRVQITPANPTLSGMPAGVPFTVTLNRGEVYQVLGGIIGGDDGYDMTGTKVRSLPNSEGKCYPIAVFSGSSRTNIGCVGTSPTASGDNIIEQNFPYQAWGKKYLTAPTSNSSGASSFHTNIYRVAVKDPTTVVRRNGTPLTGLINGFYYQFESNSADLIEADKPIIVAQIMASSTFCPNTSGGGDPAMIYVSPVEQGVKRVGLYRNTKNSITAQYLTLIIPTAGLSSLRIDGSNTFDHTYAHTLTGYTVVVKRWSPAANAQVIVSSDSAFTAITYGLGNVESYGYNAGTLVKNLNALPSITNTLNPNGGVNPYTCARSPFRMTVRLPMKPTVLNWQLNTVSVLSPNANVIQNNPVPSDSALVNGSWFYTYTLPQDYQINTAGTYTIPILVTHPEIEGCNNTQENLLTITVLPAPEADFTVNFPGCVNATAQFSGMGNTSNGVGISSWNWTFHDNTTATTQNASKQYTAAGTFNVRLRIIGQEGCVGDTTKTVTVNAIPSVTVVADSLSICTNGTATFSVQNPTAGATYRWYTAPTGGTAIATGTSFTTPALTATSVYYVDATQNGCTSTSRTRVIATVLPPLTAPVAVMDSAAVNSVRFRWNAVQNATSYEVSINNGATWSLPSSGATGLTHTVTNLLPLQEVTLLVRARGGCQDATSQAVTGKALPDDIFIPNAFTPNGDGVNDVLKVYGYTIREMQFMVFNQWGEKIFDSRSQTVAWDGTYKGKIQPSGVYMYVCRMVLNDGTIVNRKGSINLIR
jgi:gliding motility-associated-like protein